MVVMASKRLQVRVDNFAESLEQSVGGGMKHGRPMVVASRGGTKTHAENGIGDERPAAYSSSNRKEFAIRSKGG